MAGKALKSRIVKHEIPPGVNCLMRPEQVAAALSCSRAELYRLLARGEFPASESPPGKSPRWRVSTLNAWIDRTYGKGV